MTTEASSNRPFANSPGASACQVASGATLLSNNWAAFASSSGNNQVTGAASMSGGPLGYDAAGDVQQDNLNRYAYDGEGRVCAVENLYSGAITQYIYNADGTRVAKGTAHTVVVNGQNVVSCDTTQNGFTLTTTFVIGPSGEQLTETDGAGNWKHTNVFGGGALDATYDAGTGNPLYFHLSDWLGTRRVETDYAGNPCLSFTSLPYGDDLAPQSHTCLTPSQDATEHHFTGKERDTESGNDYFGARYYASAMGRWLSPDWSAKEEPVPYAKLDDPQTLNLYVYVGNNPLGRADDDGHGWIDPRKIEQFEHDVAVGALKGFGRIAFSALSMTDSRITNPAYAHMQDMPAALNYSNTTQAVAGTVAPIVLPAFGGAVTVAAEAPTIATESVEISAEIPEVMTEGTIFRASGTNPANLTGEDLSFRTSLSNPVDSSMQPVDGHVVFQPGKPAFGVDVAKLPNGSAVLDNTPPGHVTVNAPPEAIKDAVVPATKIKFPKD